MNLSTHFTLEEFTFSQTAARFNITNIPNDAQIEAMKDLCENVLEKLRLFYSSSVSLSSGYRSAALNKKVGGSDSSQHRCLPNKGAAADIHVAGKTTEEVFADIKAGKIPGLVFDQLIWENPGPNSWIHISFNKNGNRKQRLQAIFKNGKATYYTV